ncbi:MAG: DUF3786 domain-containing protein [Deltaproteobacteria bacterium]|nr:DUF3786 domain-containing protein [Deltaproteobacteria bacterium]
MPRVDDYQMAFQIAADKLRAMDAEEVAQAAGARLTPEGLQLNFVGLECAVSLDPVAVSGSDGQEVPLTDRVLILHYLTQADGRPMTGQWIAYRQIPGAQTYHPVFYQRAIAPFKAGFGPRPELLAQLTADLPARPGQGGDAAVVIQALPRTPVLLQVWQADEDFPAEANILFDESISGYLTAEDVAWLAGRVVYPLVGRAKAQGGDK